MLFSPFLVACETRSYISVSIGARPPIATWTIVSTSNAIKGNKRNN